MFILLFILAKHLHEASKHVMQNRLPQSDEMEPDDEVSHSLHYDTQGKNGMASYYTAKNAQPVQG